MVNNKVLAIDDDPDILNLIEIVLGDEGYEVVVARNGREALAYLEKDTPRLILLDLAMPVMNGSEFLCAAQEQGLVANSSVVVMTAGHGSQNTLRLAGVAGHLPKPFELDDLVRCAERHCGPAPALAR